MLLGIPNSLRYWLYFVDTLRTVNDYEAIFFALYPRSAFQQEIQQLFNLFLSGEEIRIVVFQTDYVFKARLFD